ncbi:transcriptional regulator [Rhizocola hellebori]|uniref:Transcriptional regulator n=1 Tax=Rhizocola hellebori TaxID=1392758 RepID=A0A8J3VKP3_9ACTN|nr:helix-turn-helix transcriptional regulator [Rhizocola hellebori]GIH10689.1 transcriptional regulator [Rhizocola hellebori]
MAEEINSTVPRRQLGRLLRQLRTEAGVTLDASATALEYSRQKIWRIESGMGPVRALDVKAMCDLYGVAPDMTEVAVGLAAETKSRGWWHAYGDVVPQWFELFVGLEASASRLRLYDESLIPGLLQTRGYARAVYEQRSAMSEDDRERAIDVRLQRQTLLTRRLPPPPQVEAIVSEAVLRRTIGDRGAMIEQLHQLIQVAKLPTVSVRVLPLAAGPHRGAVAGTFYILDFPSNVGRASTEPSTVYSESLTGAIYLDKPDELSAYEDVWSGLDVLALDKAESRNMINKIAGEIHNE